MRLFNDHSFASFGSVYQNSRQREENWLSSKVITSKSLTLWDIVVLYHVFFIIVYNS